MPGRILIVDDDRGMCELCESELRPRGFEVTWSTSPEEALQVLRGGEFDAILTDLNMPGITGIDLCEQVAANRPDIPVVVITAFGSLDTAIAAIRAGAYDFVTKPVKMELLALTLERAVRHRQLQEKIKILSGATDRTERCDGLLGSSEPMRRLYDQLGRVADTDATVLVLGDSGTGKELAARALHNLSRRKAAPFVAINCAAVPEQLLESELFGHAQGAFTDAQRKRKGIFLQADGGTLLLDEIAEVPLTLQSKLLRAIEERRLRPVGSDQEIPFDVRIVSSTNRDLDAAVEEGVFRKDLYFRINVVQIDLPPLRSRGTDILVLARHFLEQFAAQNGKSITGFSEAVAERLLAYDWPGNVRELRNVMERAAALARCSQLGVEDLPEKVRDHTQKQILLAGDDPSELPPMEEVEKRYIAHVVRIAGGNKSRAARLLGFDRKTLCRKLLRYGLEEKNSS